MRFEYTGRHVEVTPGLRKHVESHFKKLAHILNDTTASTHVIIEVEKTRHIAEVIVHWRDHTLTAKDTNADMYMALTRAIAKIEKQGLKLKKKIIDQAIRRGSGRPVRVVRHLDDLVPELLKLARAGDAVITLGAGSIGTVPKRLVAALRQREAGA